MSPRPIDEVHPGATYSLTPWALQDAPEAGSIALGVIATWSLVELDLFHVVTELLHGDYRSIAAALERIPSEIRQAAIERAAFVALERKTRDRALFGTAMKKINKERNTRNSYAHAIWGLSPEIPHTLVKVDTQYITHFHTLHMDAATEAYMIAHSTVSSAGKIFDESPELPTEVDRSRVLVYTRDDLTEDLAVARWCASIASNLCVALSRSPGKGQAVHQLSTLLQHRP